MPIHGHDGRVQPKMTALAEPGQFQVDRLNFIMRGPWEVRLWLRSSALESESLTLPFAIDPAVPHSISARFAIARHREIARMTVRLRMRAIDVDVLQDLVRLQDLDESVIERVPTFTLHGAAAEWRPDEPTLRSLLPDDLTCPSG